MAVHPIRLLPRLALALILSTASGLAAAKGKSLEAPGPTPSPQYSPRQVVEIQLNALQRLDEPEKDAGIATVFRFASPENRSQTGPLPRFAQMLREGYPEMLNHRSHNLSPPVVQGDEALQPVELTSRGGRILRYVFVLRQQLDGPYKDCWMTDGVVVPDDQPEGREI